MSRELKILISIVRSSSNSKDFIDLTTQLDADLHKRYGATQLNYTQFNVIESLDTVIISYLDDIPVGCGCFKRYDEDCVEIKRMFVKPENRGLGISKKILNELEKWAFQIGFSKAILETGLNQPEAIGLYEKSGYLRIANYDQYIGMSNSICFGKDLETKN
jgi:putative acetyltransferase